MNTQTMLRTLFFTLALCTNITLPMRPLVTRTVPTIDRSLAAPMPPIIYPRVRAAVVAGTAATSIFGTFAAVHFNHHFYKGTFRDHASIVGATGGLAWGLGAALGAPAGKNMLLVAAKAGSRPVVAVLAAGAAYNTLESSILILSALGGAAGEVAAECGKKASTAVDDSLKALHNKSLELFLDRNKKPIDDLEKNKPE